MNQLVKKLSTPTQPAIYVSLEEGTLEFECAENFLKWAGKDGSTHVYSDRGEPGAWEEYLKLIEQIEMYWRENE